MQIKSYFAGLSLLVGLTLITATARADEKPAVAIDAPAAKDASPTTKPTTRKSKKRLVAKVFMTDEELAKNVPDWARETLPAWVEPYVGAKGLTLNPTWSSFKGTFADDASPFERWHANRFIVYRPETAKYLYEEYTPLTVNYQKGMFPGIEALAAKYLRPGMSDTEKGVAMVTQAMAALKHPQIPPTAPHSPIPEDRVLINPDDLLATGFGRCGEQAAFAVRLCQTCNIPARIIHLFYSNDPSGHTIIEFYADGHWILGDSSWLTVFPGPDGKLMSAAQCHDGGEGQKYCGIAYEKRMHEIAQLPAEQLANKNSSPNQAKRYYSGLTAEKLSSQLGNFAMINNPLPPPEK